MSSDMVSRRATARITRIAIASAAVIAAALVASGCTCATCTATGCSNPNYGKKSHSLMQALTMPQGPTQAASNTVSAVASLPAAQGG